MFAAASKFENLAKIQKLSWRQVVETMNVTVAPVADLSLEMELMPTSRIGFQLQTRTASLDDEIAFGS